MAGQRNGTMETAQETQGAIIETAQTLRDTAADIGTRAQHYAAEAGRQVGSAAQSVYGNGNEARAFVESIVRDNVWAGLLVAGCVGYGLACLVKNAKR